MARNAGQALVLHKTKRASDLTARNRALEEIQVALGLDEVPLRIECYDISNLQGTEVVASMVVFEDGLARKSEYRRFVHHEGPERPERRGLMHQVITRRFRRLLDEQARSTEVVTESGPMLVDPETGRPRKFAYAPGLVVVDGGPPQVAAAQRALDELGIDDIPVCGLAKRLEEVWLPRREDPVILNRSSEALYLLQRVRDEAHRFAITHHRSRRSKSMVESLLDDVPGLGEVRRKTLLKHFGSLRKPASPRSVAELPIAQVRPNARQPRQVFEEEALAELVHSITEVGLLQPVVVRRTGEAEYELIMGERRWRASQEAGLDTIPAIVRHTDDNDMLRDALLENLHRSQLNPLEEAAAYGQLLEDFGCTHDELAQRIGRSRPQISNTLRLLKLSPAVQRRVGRRRTVCRSRPGPADDRGLGPPGPPGRARHGRGDQRPRSRGDRLPRPGSDVVHPDPTKPADRARSGRSRRAALGPLRDAGQGRPRQGQGQITVEFASLDDLRRIVEIMDPRTGTTARSDALAEPSPAPVRGCNT